MSNSREFAKRLKLACDQNPTIPEYGKGRQTYLAEAMNVSPESARKWFTGDSTPRHAMTEKLSKLLSVDHSWLALGVKPDLTKKQKRQFNKSAEGAVYIQFGLYVADGFTCAFADDSSTADFFCVKEGEHHSIRVISGREQDCDTFEFDFPIHYDQVECVGHIQNSYSGFDTLEFPSDLIRKFGQATGETVKVIVKRKEAPSGVKYTVGIQDLNMR